MNAAVDDCLVSGFESLEAGLTGLPDPNDRHVLAAAIHCGAQEIVTFNIRDFPDAFLHPYGIRAVHPDAFVEHLLDLNSEAVCGAIRRIRRRLRSMDRSVCCNWICAVSVRTPVASSTTWSRHPI